MCNVLFHGYSVFKRNGVFLCFVWLFIYLFIFLTALNPSFFRLILPAVYRIQIRQRLRLWFSFVSIFFLGCMNLKSHRRMKNRLYSINITLTGSCSLLLGQILSSSDFKGIAGVELNWLLSGNSYLLCDMYSWPNKFPATLRLSCLVFSVFKYDNFFFVK